MPEKDFITLGGAHYRTSMIASVTPLDGGGEAAVYFSSSIVEERKGLYTGARPSHSQKLIVEGEEAKRVVAWAKERSARAIPNEEHDYGRV